MQENKNKNRRKHEREELVFFLSVFDRKTGDHVGYLGDITPEGAMLLTEEHHSKDTEFQLNIETALNESDDDFLAINARCVRCSRNDNIFFLSCGIHFTLINPDDIDKIYKIIELLKIYD